MRKAILVFTVLGLMGLQNGCAPHPGSDLLFPKGTGQKWSPRVPSSMKWLVMLKII